MNFKGTINIPRDDMKGMVERLGGMWNGYTWIDQTTYLETAGRDALDQMLYLEAERMANGLYAPADIESERTVIISELQGGENDPEQLLDTEVTATAFRSHPYRHPTIGWLEDLQRMRRDDLYQHYRQYYIPNNATLVVVGDVELDDVLRRVEQRFGAIPSGSEAGTGSHASSRRRWASGAWSSSGRARPPTSRSRGTRPRPPHPDFFPMLVLDAALTGAKGVNLWASFPGLVPQRKARLYTALVEGGLASSVERRTAADLAAVPLLAVADRHRRRPAAGSRVGRCSRRSSGCGRKGVTEAETARARKQLRARLVFENDSVTNIAHQLGYFDTVVGPEFLAGLQAGIDRVTAEQVSDVARRRLGPQDPDGRLVPAAGVTPMAIELRRRALADARVRWRTARSCSCSRPRWRRPSPSSAPSMPAASTIPPACPG